MAADRSALPAAGVAALTGLRERGIWVADARGKVPLGCCADGSGRCD